MSDSRLAFIGAGNMASAIIGGLIRQGFPAERISAADPSEAALARLAETCGIRTSTDNTETLNGADTVLLAVKPQVMKQVLAPLSGLLQQEKPLIISIAAGIRIDSLSHWAGADLPIVRCMPNTPALIGQGMTALYANNAVSPAQHQRAEAILAAVGRTLWLDEEAQIDAVTAVSGSGPAYVFLLMEAMQAAGEHLGLNPAIARQLVQQTVLGSAGLAAGSAEPAAQLRRNVTSPGGTTERALAVLEAAGLRDTVQQALSAAANRSRELADQLGH